MSCPVMHDQRPPQETGWGGGCPVMHGSSGGAPSKEESYDQKVFKSCKDQIAAFNICQTKEVGITKTKTHCEPEANALRECELSRRKREKSTKKFEECIKNGGDALKCLEESQN